MRVVFIGWLLCVGWWGGGWGQALAQSKMEFVHKAPTVARVGQPLWVQGQILENDDLDDVWLYYRIAGESGYQSIRMSLSRGVNYRASIPAGRLRVGYVEYYVLGIDLKKKSHALLASAQKPRRVQVLEAQTSGRQTATRTSRQKQSKEPTSYDDDDTPTRGEESVVTASRKEQRIQRAPAIITVITEEDIRAEGWRDVVEMLRYVVGIDINNNGTSPDIGFRGVNPGLTFGDKIVLLIDGHNMSWRQINRNSSFISIDVIKRIEIIRGPGSALWGANALTGVINIITKTAQDFKGVSATMGGSPLSGSYFLTLEAGHELVDGLSFRGAFSVYRNHRSPLLAPIKEFLDVGGIRLISQGDEETNIYSYAQLSWKGVALRFLFNRLDLYAPMSSLSGGLGGDQTRIIADRFITKLSWLKSLSNWGVLLLWSSYDLVILRRESQYEENPFSPLPSSSRASGTSGYFALYDLEGSNKAPRFKGYYPVCSVLPQGASTPCIKISPEGSLNPNLCTLVNSPEQEKGTAYPIPLQCRPSYALGSNSSTRGNFVRSLAGHDHRVEAGIQLSAQPLKSLYLNVGIDFEYLNLLQLYSPDVWELLGNPPAPYFANWRLSGFTQAQYNLKNLVEFTAGIRFDYDQQFGFVFTPRAAIVLTPGYGLYAKLLYGRAFKAPSFQDRYYARYPDRYGNPNLKPEDGHTWEVQVGWYRRRLMAISVNAYVSRFTNLIEYRSRTGLEQFEGRNAFDGANAVLPAQLLPPGVYDQKANVEGLWTYGGEFEWRLFPAQGLDIYATFGLFYGQSDSGQALQYAANWSGSLRATYRYRFFRISAGALLVGPKRVPARSFSQPGGVVSWVVNQQQQSAPLPNWTAANDPSIETPWYIQSFASIQFLQLLGHADLVFRVTNLANLDIYDANDIILTPHAKFDFMMWLRMRY